MEYVDFLKFGLTNRYFHGSEGEKEVHSQDYARDDGDDPESETGLKYILLSINLMLSDRQLTSYHLLYLLSE